MRESVYLEESTKDILGKVLKDFGIDPKQMSSEDIVETEAYVILHRDNPDTREKLGSINIKVPLKIDEENARAVEGMGVPVSRPVFTCSGIFDAAREDDFEIRCTIRNEHGYPISHLTDSLQEVTEQNCQRIKEAIIKEVKEDLDSAALTQDALYPAL